MKVKVVKKFIDKHNEKTHKVGSIINISKERYAEILEVGKFVEEVKTTKKETE